jgi:hypothetical protein
MFTTSHQPMRTRRVVTDQGCVIPRQRESRQRARRRAIAESTGIR